MTFSLKSIFFNHGNMSLGNSYSQTQIQQIHCLPKMSQVTGEWLVYTEDAYKNGLDH